MRMKNYNCLFCKSSNFKIITDTKQFQIIQCHDCSLTQTRLLDKKFGITNALYSSPTLARKHFETQREEFSGFAKDILDMLETKKGKLLDIGCGFGWVVAEAENRGFEAMGIDSSKVYTSLGKKTLKVRLLAVSLGAFRTTERFDVIILNHVLEHIKDPVKFLQKVRTLLNPEGEVLIACPNIRSLMFWLFKERWYGLQPAQHLSQFTPQTISMVVKKSGLVIRDVSTRSLYYNPPRLKKLPFLFLTDFGVLMGLGDQVFVNAVDKL